MSKGMNELAFARQFLAALDTRPTKLSSDHVADPRSYPAQGAYTLPKFPSQPAKRKRAPSTTAPGSQKALPTLTVSLKNLKSPSSSVTLESQTLGTSIYDLKTAYAAKTNAAVDKIKLLHSKKPIPDSKTLKEVLGDAAEGAKEVEFSVMVMGGVGAGVSSSSNKASPVTSPGIEAPGPDLMSAKAPVAQGVSGAQVLKEEAFWEDLKGFLQQRVRDEGEARRLSGLFRSAWEKSS